MYYSILVVLSLMIGCSPKKKGGDHAPSGQQSPQKTGEKGPQSNQPITRFSCEEGSTRLVRSNPETEDLEFCSNGEWKKVKLPASSVSRKSGVRAPYKKQKTRYNRKNYQVRDKGSLSARWKHPQTPKGFFCRRSWTGKTQSFRCRKSTLPTH